MPLRRARFLCTGVAAILLSAWHPTPQAATDALADVRAALGGAAALEQVTSIQASGAIEMSVGARSGRVEFYFQAPDRFVRITRVARTVPSLTTQGRLIVLPLAQANPTYGAYAMPDLVTDYSVTTARYGFRGPVALGPAHGVSAVESMLGGGAREYARFAIPLLARLTDSYPANVSSTSDHVTFAGGDGVDWVLALDPITRRPMTLTWARPGGSFVMTFADYRPVQGLTWPRRFVTRLDDAVVEDVRIKSYKINGRINENVFK